MRLRGTIPFILPAVLLPVLDFLAGCGPGAPTRPAGPNVLLVTVDTLRADRLGCYGHDAAASPVTDGLAARGTLFEQAYAQRGSTWPSLASLLTGQHPVTHGVRSNGMRFAPGAGGTHLAEALTAHGYTCGAVLTNALDQDWRGFAQEIGASQEPQDENAAREAVRWMGAFAKEPFFLWVHYVAPHDPYTPPAAFQRFGDPAYAGKMDGHPETTTPAMLLPGGAEEADLAQVRALYDGEVAWSDAQIQPLLDALAGRGLLERTLVVVTSDHGEELYDHNRFFFHNASVYEPVLRIPLVLSQPGAIPAGERIDDLVQSIDLAPTILDLLGLEIPASFQGRSLVERIRGGRLADLPAVSELEDRVLVVRDDRYTWVSNPSRYAPPLVPQVMLDRSNTRDWAHRNVFVIAEEELYDRRKDPLEQWNLAPRPPRGVMDRMRAAAVAFQSATGWTAGTTVAAQARASIPPDQVRKLEALGYAAPGIDAASSGAGGDPARPRANAHSLRFDGVDDVVRVDGLPALEGEGYTLEAWVRRETGGQDRMNLLARRRPSGGADTFTFRIRADMGSVLELGLASGGREWGTAGRVAIGDARWTHVAVTCRRQMGLIRFFVDGVPEAEARSPIEPGRGDHPVWIGGDPLHGPTGRPFKGFLDEVRVWDRVLADDEIARQRGHALTGAQPGLVLYADMEEAEGQAVAGGRGVLGVSAEADASDPVFTRAIPFR